MIYRDIEIPAIVNEFFNGHRNYFSEFEALNSILKRISGIQDFFESPKQLEQFILNFDIDKLLVKEANRRQYGDFQTNFNLASTSIKHIRNFFKYRDFEFVLEPTCGKGNFILAALSAFPYLKKVVGIEIHQPYVMETKLKILEFFLKNANRNKPEITIHHDNVFNFDFDKLSKSTKAYKTLIVGNPPWVTNSELGSIDSDNLPRKANFKKLNGFDAITGKGNFDISEFITLLMLKNFCNHDGCFGFLVKNSVAKSIILEQKRNPLPFGNNLRLVIDSQKEFNVSVEACLFISEFNHVPELFCEDTDFYTLKQNTVFGWADEKFVFSLLNYEKVKRIDGTSQFVWRQGIKHDCSKVMEFEIFNERFKNGFNEVFDIEPDLVYGLLKSSDLKGLVTNDYRKLTILTQRKIGQKTNYIKCQYPRTYNYLIANKKHFEQRKSSIYYGKPDFSIFGVGEYSFRLFKVAISGMYKSTRFTLVLPDNDKPIMLDDTCYFIGFDHYITANITHYLLNHPITQQLLSAIVFPDAKRSITKDVLMRLDINSIYNMLSFEDVSKTLQIAKEDWENYGELINSVEKKRQMTLF
jgi:hypothetical protein